MSRRTSWLAIACSLATSGCPAVTRIEIDESCRVPDAVQAIFSERCTMAACHGSGSAEEGLSLEPGMADAILDRNSTQNPSLPLVEIGNVANSWLAIKIQDGIPIAPPRVMNAMPPPGAPEMPEGERAIILGWIAGATLVCSMGDTDTDTDTDTDAESGESSGGGDALQACGIDDLKPRAPNPIVAGTGVDEIPPDIADVLAINCGCHYADDLAVTVLDYLDSLPLHIDTHAGFHETLATTGDLAYLSVLDRVTGAAGAPMPPPPCEVEPGVTISPADRDRLVTWLEAGAPDGATWNP